MRLSALLAALPGENARLALHAEPDQDDPVIRGLCHDSRAVSPGDLFIALRGAMADGHAHLGQALDLGAAALLVEEVPSHLERRGRPAVVVRDTRRALAPLACAFFGHPSSELLLAGVTGTNGKTSVSYLLESMLCAAGRRVGVIGTVETRWPGERKRSLNTTPDGLEMQRTLRNMRTAGVEAAVVEVSSHGLAQGRIDGCQFAVAAFTNLTQDHLDFHGDMDRYAEAKLQLFREHLAKDAAAVINLDDAAAPRFAAAAAASGARTIGVSRRRRGRCGRRPAGRGGDPWRNPGAPPPAQRSARDHVSAARRLQSREPAGRGRLCRRPPPDARGSGRRRGLLPAGSGPAGARRSGRAARSDDPRRLRPHPGCGGEAAAHGAAPLVAVA